ncbi:MAG: hypothetical protein KGL39_07010 [Patescibacteria group bacterium]|nr:hypothetical protein [Patescibacteria group bacterium]
MGVPATLSSVPAATPYIQYVATSNQTVFPYPFPITQDADLVVVVNGVTQATDAGYTLTGQGTPGGGNVTFALGQTAGAIITLFRNIAIARISQIAQNSGFASQVFNNEFNNFYLIAQQLQASLAQCIQIPNTNNPAPVTTLLPANYANKYLAFDANGNPTPAVLTSSGSLTQALLAGLLTPQTPLEASNGIVPSNNVFPQSCPLRYGAVGNGVAADTVATQAAFTVGGDILIPNGFTFLVSAITSTTSFRLLGGGTIKQSANAGVAMISIPASAPGVNIELDNVTLDGNQAAQGSKPSNITLDYRSTGTSSAPTTVRLSRVNFLNGGVADLRIFGVQTGNLVSAFVEDCNFLGGALGDGAGTYFPRAIDVADGVDILVEGCTFDIEQSPLTGGATGKAGIVGYYNQAESAPTPGPPFTAWLRPRIIGNSFNRMGRDQANGQGSIDLYGYAVDAVISDNIIRNFVLRAINVKGTDPRVEITGNQVDTAYPGVAQTVTGIVCNASTTTDDYNDIIVEDNIVTGTTYDGIAIVGFNSVSALVRAGVQVRNNITRGCASGGTGVDIRIQACTNAAITGNQMFSSGGSACVQFQQCQGLIELKENEMISPAGRGVLCNTGDTNSLAYFEVEGNLVYSPGVNAVGCGMYFSTVGGLDYGRRNRIINPLNATGLFTDQSAVVSATISGSVMTIASVGSGTVAVGQLVTSASGAASALSIPGTFISSFGTFNGVSGTVNLSTTPTGIGSAQNFALFGQYPGGASSESAIETMTLNNNTEGVISVPGPGVYFLDTAAAAATGLCFWINGGAPGDEITLIPLNSGRMTTVKKNSGSLATGNVNLTSDWIPTVTTNSLTLVNTGTDWRQKAAN